MSNLCFRGSGKESTVANEDLLLRQMPHSLEGEQAVLGSMLIDEGCVKEVMDKLVPSDFYLRQNREIFETIYTMFTYARPIDGITVCEEMRKAGTYDENTTRSYLAQLMEITPTSANVMEYVAIVRDKALLRGVAQAAGEITALVQEGIGEAGEILEAAEQKIYAVRRGQSAQDMVPLRMVLPEVLDRLSEMSESESRLPGLSTGLSAVDRKITGLNRVDPGENYHTAAIRGLKEETGLKLEPIVVDDIYQKPYYTSVGMTDECCGTVYGYASGEISKKYMEDSEEIEVVLADRKEVARIMKEERVALLCAYMMMHFLHDEEPFAFLHAKEK